MGSLVMWREEMFSRYRKAYKRENNENYDEIDKGKF